MIVPQLARDHPRGGLLRFTLRMMTSEMAAAAAAAAVVITTRKVETGDVHKTINSAGRGLN